MAIPTRHGIGYKELEAATGIPSTTARRYAKRFPAFLPCRVVDRSARFQPESVDTFRRIHSLFTAGRRAEKIAAILAGEVPQVHDVATPATTATPPATTDPAALLPILERLTVAVEALAAAQAETVALLRETREKPPELPQVAPEISNPESFPDSNEEKGEARQEEKKPLWVAIWRRCFSGK